jgi:hypothetical protein
MKKFITSVIITAGLVIASAGTAAAQIVTPMKFTTTFPFMIGNTMLPAGAYTVSPVGDDSYLMKLSNGRQSVLILTEGDRPKSAPRTDEIIFTRRGDTYRLREIWDAGSQTGVAAIPSRTEHEPERAKDMSR